MRQTGAAVGLAARPRRRPRGGPRRGPRGAAPPPHGRRRRRPAGRLAPRRGHRGARAAGRLERGLVVAAGPGGRGATGRPTPRRSRASSGSARPAIDAPGAGRRCWPTRRPSGTRSGPTCATRTASTAALAVASLAAAQAARGRTLLDALDAPARAARRPRHRQLLAAGRGARRRRRGGRRWSSAWPPRRRPASGVSGVTGGARLADDVLRLDLAAAPASSSAPAAPSRSSSATARPSSRCAGGPSRRRGRGPGSAWRASARAWRGCSWPDARARSVPRSPHALALAATAGGPCSTASPASRPSGSRPLTAWPWRSAPPGSTSRSIKRESKRAGLELAIRCIDLTTLEGADTPGKVRAMCARALRPDPDDPTVPPVAAVCVYGALVGVARDALAGTPRAGGLGRGRLPVRARARCQDRLDEIRRAVADGADEIDIVLNRGALLAGRLDVVHDEVAASKEACGDAHLKTILETGELGLLRDRAPGLDGRDGGRQRRHQDLHRQAARRPPRRRPRSAWRRRSATTPTPPAARWG